MDEQRVHNEIDELRRDYRVKASLKKGYVMITRFGYPEGWSPRTAPLFYSLPPTYPRRPPDVYLPPDMRFRGRGVEHMLPPNDDGWYKWCVERLDWKPRHHDLITMTELMKRSLSNPNAAEVI
jgi:hypothetical protein